MRERLIELIMASVGGCARHWAEVIADHLLANGVIVLPCKVGDFVEAKGWWLRNLKDFQITHIEIMQNKKGEWKSKCRAMRSKDGKTFDSQLNFSFDDIGKTVFLTREEAEEAEKALAERSKG